MINLKMVRSMRMTQKDFAKKIGVSPQFVSMVEHGERKLPKAKYDLVEEILEGYSIDYLTSEFVEVVR